MVAASIQRNTVVRFMTHLVTGVFKHDIASLAAAITFYACFSLFPFMLLAVYVASIVVPETHVVDVLLNMMSPYIPDVQKASLLVYQHIASLAMAGQKISLLSVVTLFWSAMSGFIAIQQAMDVIWEAEQRSFLARRFLSFLLVMFTITVFFAITVITTLYTALKGHALLEMPFFSWIRWLHGWSAVLFPVTLFFGFLIVYRYLPSRRMSWDYVMPGAAVATVLLDAGRNLFVWYASRLVSYQMVYGTLSAVMLLVFWVYLGSILMLLGAEVCAALERIPVSVQDS